jgi:carbonic anhydrase
MNFFNSKLFGLILIISVLSYNDCKASLKLRTKESTIFGFLRDIIEPPNMNQTKYPPYSPSCINKTANVTEVASFDAPNITVVNVTQPLIILPTATPTCNENWTYEGRGSNWECICSEGQQQSPIDLPKKDDATLSPIRPVLNYEVIKAGEPAESIDMMNRVQDGLGIDDSVKIRYHNGAIKILHPNLGKLVKIDGSVFMGEEIQFHTPSEHTIAGQRFDMEMHVIHYGYSQGDIAKQAVLSFLFKKSPGKYNKFIDSLDFYSLPNPINNYRELYNDIYIPNVLFSSDDDRIPVMTPFSFYTYEGSLTFPPCTERTTYYVHADPLELSSTAISLFKEALRKPDRIDEHGNLVVDSGPTPENYRATQPSRDREVFIYDHNKYDCPVYARKPKKVQPAGHYEKRLKDATNYIYVNSAEPSGIPGAFVVTEAEAKGLEEAKKDEQDEMSREN